MGSQTSGIDRANLRGEEHLQKLVEEEDEEDEPMIERRKKNTGFWLDLDEREEQVVCHVPVLAVTGEAHRETEM